MDLSGAEATAFAAVLAALVGLSTLRLNAVTARRSAWWTRAEWAMDRSFDVTNDELRDVGSYAIAVLVRDRHAPDADLRVLQAALQRVLDRPSPVRARSVGPGASGADVPARDVARARADIAAARALVEVDRRLGEPTRPDVAALALIEPSSPEAAVLAAQRERDDELRQ